MHNMQPIPKFNLKHKQNQETERELKQTSPTKHAREENLK